MAHVRQSKACCCPRLSGERPEHLLRGSLCARNQLPSSWSICSTLDPTLSTRTPQLSTLNPQPSTLNPQPPALHSQPSTRTPQPSSLNPNPSTLLASSCLTDHRAPRGFAVRVLGTQSIGPTVGNAVGTKHHPTDDVSDPSRVRAKSLLLKRFQGLHRGLPRGCRVLSTRSSVA